MSAGPGALAPARAGDGPASAHAASAHSLRWRCQTHPQMPGVGAYDLDIASAELPCGASWIGSVLLELGVGLWHAWGADSSGEWQALGGSRWRYQRVDEGWTRLLPGLRHGREFRLRKRPVPRLGHHWPGQYPALPALLVVRDPRDALFSAWRRERAAGNVDPDIDFAAFVASPFRHWPLSWAGYLALHTQAWRAVVARRGLVLRFEDCKRAPLEAATRVLDFLGLRVSRAQLLAAVAASEHREVAAAEQRLLDLGIAPTRLLASGTAEEWRGHFAMDMHAALPAWLWRAFAPLGYRPLTVGSDAPPGATGLREFLHGPALRRVHAALAELAKA